MAKSKEYPGSGYTSALGQQPAGPGRASQQNSIENAKSLSPSKNSISQNGQMILNLNKNTIHCIMRSTDAEDFFRKKI
jgi:hypothetical protein